MNAGGKTTDGWKRADTDWFRDCRWGVFTHYLTGPETTTEEWNRQVDGFDARRLAEQLESVGARYYFMTLGQNSGHYCAPNAAYDRRAGVRPGKCSRRDLVADIQAALAPKGIRTLAYATAQAPNADPVAQRGFGLPQGAKDQPVDEAFAHKWAEVIREWSVRYGRRVEGWWFDGCYQWIRFDDTVARIYAEAVRAGNPDSIVAFNPGVKVPVISATRFEDYTAGELSGDLPVGGWGLGDNPAFGRFGPVKRWVDGAQYHVLNFLGPFWGQSPPRFPTELVVGYTRYLNAHEGLVTWDVPIEKDGRIPEPFLAQLRAVGEATGTLQAGPRRKRAAP